MFIFIFYSTHNKIFEYQKNQEIEPVPTIINQVYVFNNLYKNYVINSSNKYYFISKVPIQYNGDNSYSHLWQIRLTSSHAHELTFFQHHLHHQDLRLSNK